VYLFIAQLLQRSTYSNPFEVPKYGCLAAVTAVIAGLCLQTPACVYYVQSVQQYFLHVI